MGIEFAFLMGRVLIIPVALSGVCLSMLSGIPIVYAMEMDQTMMRAGVSSQHEMAVFKNQDHGTQSGCCTTARMLHDTKVATSEQGKAYAVSCIADVPHDLITQQFDDLESTRIPRSHLSLHQQFSLTGTIFKRE